MAGSCSNIIELLRSERVHEPSGFRAHGARIYRREGRTARGRTRSLGDQQASGARVLTTKGLENGSHLRADVNAAESIEALREIISTFS